ncbi:UDP-2,4-diacetamido-2,4,6-trideoxy-beta-L-altropyranose hydrolase [Vibrio sp. D420a]|uniref:UDP-2,4-diacetamido-2,4, 6-trideoxy-beta-L-altropyranose hydrolase n=1 Tax=Vibrio sp. D420a TaxID=2836895 RepID=UPI0025536601|nr:UDP-2,4-diacetamido-2,4,6-trideoxy-beta-L-altropyranose hydrolase [Vibrio sp. D420a]MDK9762850.1 UDP-2,4-diacetamido-2,4,6-trideoxy-beta-L-altropyranose hydrolase [Vibrio sp. D420a]
MKLAIRVDTGTHIGSGHLMRCLTLAKACLKINIDVVFISRQHPGHQLNLLPHDLQLIPLQELPLSEKPCGSLPHSHWLGCTEQVDSEVTIQALEDIDFIPNIVLVDHYALSEEWETRVRDHFKCQVIAIDGLLDRPHQCQYLVNPTLTKHHCVPGVQQLLEGPKYLPLRDEFRMGSSPRVRQSLNTYLICFGGVDKDNWTLQTYLVLREYLEQTHTTQINIVVGGGYPYLESLKEHCSKHSATKLYIQTSEMSYLMENADIMIGAGGTIAWERCALGLPAICWATADNQRVQNEKLEQEGAIVYLGTSQNSLYEDLTMTLDTLIKDKNLIKKMSLNSAEIMRDWPEKSLWLRELKNGLNC